MKSADLHSNLKTRAIQVAVTLVFVLVAVLHSLLPERVDAIDLGLLVLACTPWLLQYAKSFEAFGVKIELDKLVREVENLRGQAEDASQKADNVEASRVIERHFELTEDPNRQARRLATMYNTYRRESPRSDVRTNRMTELVGQMTTLASKWPGVESEVLIRWLSDKDPGMRLFAYSYLYVRPTDVAFKDLVRATEAEDKSFSQYWGILATGRVTALFDIPQILLEPLVALYSRLPVGSDRRYALGRILADLIDVER